MRSSELSESILSCAVVSCAILLSACAASTEPFTLDFPSREAFVRSTSAEVFVVALAPDDLDACPRLLADAERGGVTMAGTTGSVPVCDFRDGVVDYPDVAQGAMAYVGVARDDAGEVLLSGCVVRNVYVDDVPLNIILTPTNEYRTGDPSSCTVDQKCGGGCP